MREAKLNFDNDGNPLGITLVLSAEELRELGVNPEGESVAYWVEDGELQLEER